MEAANQSLNELAKTVPSDELDIENIDECSGPVIEMVRVTTEYITYIMGVFMNKPLSVLMIRISFSK